MAAKTEINKWKNRKFTKARFKKAVEGSGGFLSVIAKRLNCSRQTVHTYRDELQDVRDWIESEDELLGDVAESQLAKHVKEGDLRAIEFYLTTKQKKRGYAKTQIVDNRSSDGSMSPKEKASPEEYAKAVAAETEGLLQKYHGIDDKAV